MRQRHLSGLTSGARIDIGGRVRGTLAIVVPAVGLAVALVATAPADRVLAQENTGGSINIGGNIAATVADAVSGIATSSNASGGVQSTHSELSFGEKEGLAISDASGGNHNASTTQK